MQNETDKDLQAGQQRLAEKRREFQAQKPAEAREAGPIGSMLERYGMLDKASLFTTDQTSGQSPERCTIHRLDFEDGECPECRDQREKEEEKNRKAATDNVEKRLGSIRLGARYQGVKFEDYRPTCPEAVKVLGRCRGYAHTFPERLKDGTNLLMLGNVGTGKNMLAAAICNQVVLSGHTAVHTTVLKMLRRIKETWRRSCDEKEQDVIDSFALPDLLVVDEIGVQFGTESERILTFEALNGRYEERKPTILISNFTEVSDLQAYLGERVMDRMREGNIGVLKFTWGSYRGGQHEA